MKSTNNHLVTAAALLLAIVACACNLPTGPVVIPPVIGDPTEICIWVSADKDAFVSSGPAGQEGNLNFGRNGTLGVANGPLGRKHTYVHFTPPTLPAGSEILEAKLELFHGARNGDGSTDDINLAVGRVLEPWSPQTITWNNQPYMRGLPSSETTLRLRSQAWSGTRDISGAVDEMLASPSTNHGFIVWYQDPSGRQVDKGFYSNNDYRRKQNDLGLSPRLLIRVKLPAGKTAADLQIGYLAADHDLGALAQPVTMVRVTTISTWPADWNVTNE
jgi:hypothetical protein